MKEKPFPLHFPAKQKRMPKLEILERIDGKISTIEEMRGAKEVKEKLRKSEKVIFLFKGRNCKTSD